MAKRTACSPSALPLSDLLNQFPVATVDPVKFSHCYCTVGKLWKLTLYLQVFHNLSCQTSLCLIGDCSAPAKSSLYYSEHFHRIIFLLPCIPLKNTCKSSVTGVHAHPAFFVLGTHQIVGQRISILPEACPRKNPHKELGTQPELLPPDRSYPGRFHLPQQLPPGQAYGSHRENTGPPLTGAVLPYSRHSQASRQYHGTRCGYRFPYCRSLLFSPAEDANSRGSIS